jgi:tetratricopeptide (TPR) repeat protein
VKAIISGQAGVAILVHDGNVYTIDVDSDQPVECELADMSHLIGEARDAYWLRDTSRERVVIELEDAWRRDRALQLMLILLDREEVDGVRMEAAECLEDLLAGEQVREQLGSVMYSSPLPDTDAVDESITFAKPSGPLHTFLRALSASQKSVVEWCMAWEAIPAESCGGPEEKRRLRLRAIRAGAFRVFVEEQGRGDAALMKLLIADQFKGNTRARKVLQGWAAQFRKRITNTDFVAESADEGTDAPVRVRFGRRRRSERSGHTAYTSVKAFKDAIKRLLEQGKWQWALKNTQDLIHWQRGNSEVEHISMSLCDLAQHGKKIGDLSWHLELSRWAVKEKANDSWAHAQVGDAYRLIGDYDAAVDAYERAGYFGGKMIAMCGRARILLEHGQVSEALQIYEKCEEQFTSAVIPRCGRAAALASVGRLSEAEATYRKVIVDIPEDCDRAERGLGYVLGEMGRFDEAREMFDAVVARFPNEDAPRCARAEVLRGQGRLDEALQAFQAIVEKMPYSTRACNGRARVLKEMGRLEAALAAYSEVIGKFERHTTALLGRADTLKKLGCLDDSAEAYRTCLNRVPRHMMAKNGLASVLAAQGRFPDALAILPDGEPASYAEWLGFHLRSTIYLAQGQLNQAESRLVTALNELPWVSLRPLFNTALAGVRIRLREFDSAADLVAEVPRGSVWPIAKLIEVHACGMLNFRKKAAAANEQLKADCPSSLKSIREAFARRFVQRQQRIQFPNDQWVHRQECYSLFLAF